MKVFSAFVSRFITSVHSRTALVAFMAATCFGNKNDVSNCRQLPSVDNHDEATTVSASENWEAWHPDISPGNSNPRDIDTLTKMSYLDPMVTSGKPREIVGSHCFYWTLITFARLYRVWWEPHGIPVGYPWMGINHPTGWRKPKKSHEYDFELPDRTSELKNKNFLMRMLYKQCGCGSGLSVSQS